MSYFDELKQANKPQSLDMRATVQEQLVEACAEVDSLRAQLAAARLDSERLDWLETEEGSEWGYVQMEKHGWMPRVKIDAARAQSGAPERKEQT